ncbi:hypothetical protein [Marinicrinis sediminis]|uniref:SH3 domain-containing protein n=1 Tax=Marinicrinis sediminis TaxID=1652465 RepID=A0ABW5RAX9_9BACL
MRRNRETRTILVFTLAVLWLVGMLVLSGCDSGDHEDAEQGSAKANTSGAVSAGGSDTQEGTNETTDDTVDDEQVAKQTYLETEWGLTDGEKRALPATVILYEQPYAQTAVSYVDELKQGTQVEIIDAAPEEEMVKVRTTRQQGWVPAWMLMEKAQEMVEVTPYEMIVKQQTSFYLYPEQEEPYGFELEKGRVVQIQKEFDDWVEVDFLIGDAGYIDHRWMRKDRLMRYEDDQARDGLVIPGRTAYADFRFGVWIIGEEDGEYQVEGPGGATGTVPIEDFIPNPFANPLFELHYTHDEGMDRNWIVADVQEDHFVLERPAPTESDPDSQLDTDTETDTNGDPDAEVHRDAEGEAQVVTAEDSLILPFEDLLVSDTRSRLKPVLRYPTTDVELAITEKWVQQLMTDTAYREAVKEQLDQPFTVLTLSDFDL